MRSFIIYARINMMFLGKIDVAHPVHEGNTATDYIFNELLT